MKDLSKVKSGELVTGIINTSRKNSDFNGEETHENGTIIDLKHTTGKRVDSNGVDQPSSMLVYQNEDGVKCRTWVDTSKIYGVTDMDIGVDITVVYLNFETAKEYKAGGLKVGDVTAIARSVKRRAVEIKEKLTYKDKADIFAKACADAGVAPAFA